MKKLVLLSIIALSAVGIAFGGAKSETPATGTGPITLRFCDACTAQDNHGRAMTKVKETVEALTNGQIKLELYFNSSLFAQDAATEAIMSGDLDMGYLSSQWAAAYVDEANMFTAMYIFSGLEHQNAVLNGEIGKKLFKTISDKIGVLPLASYYYGSRHVLMRSADKIIKTPSDMNGVIIRKPNTPEWLFVGEALGAKPTPLAIGEIYTAMQQGTIDAIANPLPTIINRKFYEVGKEIVLTGHIVDAVWPSISTVTWNKLSPDLQDKLMQAIEAGRKDMEASMTADEKDAIAFLESKGLVVVQPDVNAFKEYAFKKYVDTGRTKLWDMNLYNGIQQMTRNIK
jgi:tripartite ATP-independent transporter DctP family solute receptor